MLATLFSLIAVVGLFVQRRTSFGRRLYLVGANPRAAYLSGIAVRGTLIGAYAVSGVVAALAGLALLARAGLPTDFTGMGLHFQALAAVVLGGTTFEGGRGGVEGTIAGVLILAVSFALVTIMGLSLGVQLLVRGGVICAAGALYALLQRKGGQ
jgi:ribose/xylose/arabinose/galactoside ABC-type transport system permease subunit